MATEDLKSVSSVTGTFRQLPAQDTARAAAAAGKSKAPTGNNVPAAEMTAAEVEELASQLNAATQSIGRDLRFQVDMQKGTSVIQVLDRDTGEVIRQIPPEKAKIYVASNGAMALRLYDAQV